MANVKISELPVVTLPILGTSEVPMVQNGVTVKTSVNDLRDFISVTAFGAVGDGVTDDTVALQNAFNATPNGGVLEFEAGKTYLITSTLLGYNISLSGNGATLVSTGQFAQFSLRQNKGNIVVSIAATNGQYVFNLGVATSVAVGDIVRLRSNSDRLPAYKHGFLATVTNVAGNVITVDRSCYGNFTINLVDIFGASNGVTISNLNGRQTFTAAAGNQCWQVIGNNVTYQGCTLVGSAQTARGITGLGNNITVRNCYVEGFKNIDGDGSGGRTGYGAEIHGNNLLWENCTFVECKDGTSTGSRECVNTNAIVRGCYSFARDLTASASFDAHANLLDDFIVDGCYADTTGKGVNIRNGRGIVQNSYFQTTATSSSGANFVSVYESTAENIIIRGNTFVRTGGSTNNVIYINSTTPDPNGAKNITIDNNRITNARIFDTDSGAVTKITVTNNYGREVDWVVGFDDCNITDLVISGNDFTLNNIFSAVGTISSASINFASISDNKFSSLATSLNLMRFPLSSFLVSLNGLNFTNNYIDATGMSATSYMIDLFQSVSAITKCKFIGNTILRGANFRFFRITGSAITKTSITDFVWSNNIADGGIGFTDCDFTRTTFNNNIFNNEATGNLAIIAINALANTPVLDNVLISGNNIKSGVNAGNNGIVYIDGVMTYTTPIVVSNNYMQTAANVGRAVYATASAVGNQIDFKNNVARGRFEDASATFAIKPVGNRIYGGPQLWKGGATVDVQGNYYLEAAPTTGTWAQGEQVYDPTPAASGFIGFVCTTAGTPGTWKTWGAISA